MGIKISKLNNPVLVSLGIVVLAGGLLAGVMAQSNKKTKTSLLFGNNINSFDINLISLRNENGWQVTSKDKKYPGDTIKLDQLSKQISQLELGNPVSVNKDKFIDFGFADNAVTLKTNNKSVEIGNMTSDYQSTYIKADDKVYTIPFVWNNAVFGDENYWKNTTITNLPLYQVKKVIISKNNKETVVEQKDGKWANEKFVEKAAHLTAKDIMDKPVSNNTESATISVEIEGGNKSSFVLGQWVKSRKETIYWAKDDKNNYYQISKDDFDLLTR